jgi:hypothetical protein
MPVKGVVVVESIISIKTMGNIFAMRSQNRQFTLPFQFFSRQSGLFQSTVTRRRLLGNNYSVEKYVPQIDSERERKRERERERECDRSQGCY